MTLLRNLILRFLLFIAAVWGLARISLMTLIVGIGLAMAVVAAMHILATPED